MRTALSLVAVLGACTASSDEVRPDDNKLFFPTGAAMAPDESILFVANGNSDLTYDSGAISVLPLQRIDEVASAWVARQEIPGDCAQDADFTETLVCEEAVLLEAAGVRIGNFATELAVQDLGGGNLRVIAPTRGDPSIAWADWDGSRLSCTASSETFALCDDTHRLSFTLNDADLQSIPDEPYGVFADSAGEFAMVTHLTSGSVTLIDSPKAGDARVTDIVLNVFAADSSNNIRGATGVAGRTPTLPGDIIYVGSRSEDRIQTFTVGRPLNGAPPFLLSGNYFFLDLVGAPSTGDSNDTRGMTFSPNGDRLYLVNRRPPTLQVIDTSLGPTGFPRNRAVGVVDICRQASTVTVADTDPASPEGERVYVSCFQDGQIYVIDPRGAGAVVDILTVGRGPYSVVAAPGRKKLYVTNFLEDTVAVVDIDPLSPKYNRVVLRIGVPRSL